jgi:phosphoribosylglycinamide formyltransferase-1
MNGKIKRIAIFASGSGSNAEKIIEYFKESQSVRIEGVYSNRKNAKVLERAADHNISTYFFTKADFFENTHELIQELKDRKIDLIVLAGFLLLIPELFVDAFPKRIINIHPSLLPKYGGKGMYGIRVHEAVSESGDTETGITVHFVNKEFDKGKVISQVKCLINAHERPEKIASKVLEIEHQYFPMIIDQLLENKYYEGS